MSRLDEIRRRDKDWSGTFRQTHWDRRYLLAKLDEAVGFLRRHVCVQVDGGECDVCTFLRSLDTDQEGVEG